MLRDNLFGIYRDADVPDLGLGGAGATPNDPKPTEPQATSEPQSNVISGVVTPAPVATPAPEPVKPQSVDINLNVANPQVNDPAQATPPVDTLATQVDPYANLKPEVKESIKKNVAYILRNGEDAYNLFLETLDEASGASQRQAYDDRLSSVENRAAKAQAMLDLDIPKGYHAMVVGNTPAEILASAQQVAALHGNIKTQFATTVKEAYDKGVIAGGGKPPENPANPNQGDAGLPLVNELDANGNIIQHKPDAQPAQTQTGALPDYATDARSSYGKSADALGITSYLPDLNKVMP